MKTLLTFALAMSMFLTGFAEPTNELAALSNVSIHDQKAKITLLEGIGRVKVFVKDTKGKTLYCTSYKVSEDVIMPFNLEELPAGKYVIRIQTKDSSIDYDVETTAKKAKDYGFKAHVKALDDRFVKVSLYEMLEKGGVTVKVFDSGNRLLMKEHVDGGTFARKYEFKNLSTNGLYFIISDKKGHSQIYHL
ncbi:MAG TPA: hypothetical protein VK921_19055 [Anditalea sp.]|nr:hypothetical protein [Anditalea sp.]